MDWPVTVFPRERATRPRGHGAGARGGVPMTAGGVLGSMVAHGAVGLGTGRTGPAAGGGGGGSVRSAGGPECQYSVMTRHPHTARPVSRPRGARAILRAERSPTPSQSRRTARHATADTRLPPVAQTGEVVTDVTGADDVTDVFQFHARSVSPQAVGLHNYEQLPTLPRGE